ncbi:MAG: hypothetical protein K2K98_01250 [Muribaculaceae bacterium]|nr:hypothetical protein [Muribaculaceae bacterium]
MKIHLHSLRTVALSATVVLLGGFLFQDASAKTVRNSKTIKKTQMKGPDFAYPQTVEKNASEALDAALAHGDWPAAVDATIQIATAENLVSHGNAVRSISKIDSVAAAAPSAWRPAFQYVKACVYSSIYGSIRWQADSRKLPLNDVPENPYEWSREIFADKVFSLCSKIMDESAGDSRPLKDWAKFIDNASDAYALGMTVEEFLSSRCFAQLGNFADETRDVIPFFSTNSTPVTPGQKCSSLRDKAIDRLIESSAKRGQSLLLAQAIVDKANILPSSMRMRSLLDGYERVKGTEGEQLILSNLRDFVNEDPMSGMESPFPYTEKQYLDLLRKSVTDFPKGRYVNNLKNIINDMCQPASEIWYMGQYLTSSDITLEAKLVNCNESWALIYDYAPYANSSDNQPKTKEIAARCRLVKAVRLSADGTIPFNAKTKANVGRLPKGTYVVIPSATDNGKGIYSNILNHDWRQPFTVSDISVMTLQYPDAKTRVFVVDGADGHPVEGAQVKVYSRKNYSTPRKLVNTLTTDKDGSVTISEERFEIEAFFNGSKWTNDSRYYNSTARRDTTVRNYVQILADRALLHPGDSVKAAVVAYSSRDNDMQLNEGMAFDVILRDANGKEVTKKYVKTDRFGRATVDFEVPSQGLLGAWQLLACDANKRWLGSASIQVADYVAPTFFITSEHSDEDVNPGDVVSLKGQVLTYSGMPVGGATVRYSVSYTPPMRWFASGFATYDSSVVADADGKYSIDLPTANLKGTPFERGIFSVQLSATSPAGESQNGPTERFAIGKEYNVYASAHDVTLDIADSIPSVYFFVNDMLGRRVKKELSYEMIDNTTKEIVASGTFTSPLLDIPAKDYPSALYTVNVTMKEDPQVKAEMLLTLWRNTDREAPAGTKLWVPSDRILVKDGQTTADVSVGSGVADRWIPAVLSADGEILKTEWLHVEKENLSIPVMAPKGSQKYQLNLNWMSDLDTDMANVQILPASSEEKLKVKTETFRDKVSAGDVERWSFRFLRGSHDLSSAEEIPAFAVMTDAALNAITPFKWNFSPNSGRYGIYYSMRDPGNLSRYMRTDLSNVKYLSYSSLSMPAINDYGMRWGLDGGINYGSGAVYITGGVVNEMAVMRSAPQRMMMKSSAPAMASMATADADDGVMEDMIAEVEEEAALEEPMIRGVAENGETAVDADKPELRDTQCPVAFFMPNLVSDKDGIVNVDFTVPNFNTTWAFQMIGYDRELQIAKTTLETVASKPIMVSAHAPRFVRTGDAIALTATVFNNSDAKCSPKCRIELIDLISGKSIAVQDFTPESIDISSSRLISMLWDVPSDVSAVGFRVYAEANDHRDGEQALVPVLPASSPVVESTPFWMAPGSDHIDVKLPKFKDTDQVTLQYCDNPAWYCLTALPDIVKPDSKSVTAKMKALFGNTVAYNLISSRPVLKSGLEILLSDKDSEFAALKSNLEKDGNLKITQLSNTPWVNNAESETLRMSRLGFLLDDTEATKTIGEILDDVRSLQMSDGGWSWCPEMESSTWITSEVLRYFAMIVRAGAEGCLGDSKSMISNGIRYVDSETVKNYKKYHKKGESLSYLLDWLYVRGSFSASYISSGSAGREMNSIADKARKDIGAEWKDWGIGRKAKAAIVLWRGGDHSKASEILESLRQYASESPEKGMWFDNLNSGWGGMSVLQTTTLVLEAFAEIQPSNAIVDSLRQWLVLGRQYQDWGKDTYTVETVNAILTSGSDWYGDQASLASSTGTSPEISLKGKKIKLPESAKLTGAFTLTLDAKDASGKTLSVSRKGASPAWGGVISQYEAPIMEVKPADVPELSIRKSIVALVEGADGKLIPKEGIELKKGMMVRVTLFINAGRDMDYVAVTDERSACLEPVDQLSGYRRSDGIGFYREVRDSQTNLFFGWMPKGQHVVSFDCRVSQDGQFSCGIATAQSQYSPTTVAHSAGMTLNVK